MHWTQKIPKLLTKWMLWVFESIYVSYIFSGHVKLANSGAAMAVRNRSRTLVLATWRSTFFNFTFKHFGAWSLPFTSVYLSTESTEWVVYGGLVFLQMWRPPKAFRFCQCIELCWAEALFAFGGCFLSPQLGRHCDRAPSSVMRRAAKEACNTLHRVCAKKLQKICWKNESFIIIWFYSSCHSENQYLWPLVFSVQLASWWGPRGSSCSGGTKTCLPLVFHEVSWLRSSTCEVFAGGPPLRIGDKGLEFELGTGSEGQFCRPLCSFFLPSWSMERDRDTFFSIRSS